MAITKNDRRSRRKKSIRSYISGTSEIPRLTVFRSNKFIYAQLINDETSEVLCSASTNEKTLEKRGGKNEEAAKTVGARLAEKAKAKNIEKVVFDRNGYLYHGKIKALADSCRENGLKF